MSVNMNVRRVGPKLLAALRRDASLTSSLCDGLLDFDAAAYEVASLADVPAEGRDAARARLAPRLARAAGQRREALEPLLAAGLSEEELGDALHLGRAFWGMDELIGAPAGQRIVAEAIGEPVGGDVGYGPARLISPEALAEIAPALDAVTLADGEPRFRAREAKYIADLTAQGLTAPAPCTAEELDEWTWRPFCALRVFVREALDGGAWLLRWYD